MVIKIPRAFQSLILHLDFVLDFNNNFENEADREWSSTRQKNSSMVVGPQATVLLLSY